MAIEFEPGLFQNLSDLVQGGMLAGWGTATSPWFMLSLLAILVSGLIFGVFYSLAYAFNMMHLKRYAKTEFFNLAATAVMVIFLISIINMGNSFLLTEVAQGQAVECGEGREILDPIDLAICRTEERVIYYDNLVSGMSNYWTSDFANYRANEWFYHMSFSFFGITLLQGSWFPSVHRLVETHHVIAYKVVGILVSLNSQMFLLQYIKSNMLPVFLPLGIILRTFHFTRGIGGFLISLAIGLAIVYPVVLFFLEADPQPLPLVEEPPSMIDTGICDLPMYQGFSVGMGGAAIAGAPPGAGTSAATATAKVDEIAKFISDTWVRLFYNNLIAFAMALTVMRYSMLLLGGESGIFFNMISRWM